MTGRTTAAVSDVPARPLRWGPDGRPLVAPHLALRIEAALGPMGTTPAARSNATSPMLPVVRRHQSAFRRRLNTNRDWLMGDGIVHAAAAETAEVEGDIRITKCAEVLFDARCMLRLSDHGYVIDRYFDPG